MERDLRRRLPFFRVRGERCGAWGSLLASAAADVTAQGTAYAIGREFHRDPVAAPTKEVW